MGLLASSFAAALLSLLLASRAANASSGPSPAAAGSHQRHSFAPSAEERGAARQQPEDSGDQNDAEALDMAGTAPSWYRMLPSMGRGEEGNAELAPNSMSVLKDGWDAMAGQVRKFSPEQIRQAALAQMARFRTANVGEEELKIPPFLQKVMEDPETRRQAVQLALGALSATAAGLVLGDVALLRSLGFSTLFVVGLLEMFKNGAQLAGKVASEQEGVRVARSAVRQRLAKLLGVHQDNEAKEDGATDKQ